MGKRGEGGWGRINQTIKLPYEESQLNHDSDFCSFLCSLLPRTAFTGCIHFVAGSDRASTQGER